MKNITIIITLSVLFVNILIKLIFPSYETFNVCLNSATIIVHAALLLLLQTVCLKDAFRISLGFLYSTLSLAMYVWGFFVPSHIEGNISLLAMVLLVFFEIMVLIITNTVTKKCKN